MGQALFDGEEEKHMSDLETRYLERLSELYPTIAAASTEVINLEAILNLPKGTEHFLTDIHGEYEAFSHVLKNGSGAVYFLKESQQRWYLIGYDVDDKRKAFVLDRFSSPVSYTHLVQPQKLGNRKNLGSEVRQGNRTDKRGASTQPLP